MQLSHFTSTEISELYDVTQDMEKKRGFAKPLGFWISVDGADDWPSWCIEENFCLTDLLIHYRITLAEDHNVLILDNADDVLTFHNKFFRDVDPAAVYRLDWSEVCEQWDGIIIAPYQWSLRLSDNTPWYYSWDCASGCIWTPSKAIKSIERIK